MHVEMWGGRPLEGPVRLPAIGQQSDGWRVISRRLIVSYERGSAPAERQRGREGVGLGEVDGGRDKGRDKLGKSTARQTDREGRKGGGTGTGPNRTRVDSNRGRRGSHETNATPRTRHPNLTNHMRKKQRHEGGEGYFPPHTQGNAEQRYRAPPRWV
jgi:hypothetical protein